jgi:hypothetical protein
LVPLYRVGIVDSRHHEANRAKPVPNQ